MTQLVKVIAEFTAGKTGEPIKDGTYRVRIYDNDVISDDFLAEGKLGPDGIIEIVLDLGKISSPDSPAEKKPDIYFEVVGPQGVVFQSRVFKNVDFLSQNAVTDQKNSLTKDFGTFEI